MQGLNVSWLHLTLVPSLVAFVYLWRRLIVPLQLSRAIYFNVMAFFTLLVASAPVVVVLETFAWVRPHRGQLFALCVG